MPDHQQGLNQGRQPDTLEQELTAGLRRVPAPAGFADKVMLRVNARRPVVERPFTWAIAAMLLVVLLPAVQQRRAHRRAAETARTSQQFALAMRITQATLLHAGQHLRKGSPGFEKSRPSHS